MRLVVGLGNPGPRFRRTRHNVGFMVADTLATRWGAADGRVEHDAWVCAAQVAGTPVLVAKPLTFMNRSGSAVEPLTRAHHVEPGDLLVIVDDYALELGSLRIRERGSHGGHNGLRSLIDVLGTDAFPRVRIGIRRGDVTPSDLADYVLSDFTSDEVLVVQEAVGTAADAVECALTDGLATAMTRFNTKARS